MEAKTLTRAAVAFLLFGLVTGCTQVSWTEMDEVGPDGYEKAPEFLAVEIQERIYNLQFQEDAELYQSMKRLAYIGEPAIPLLLKALDEPSPRTRGSVAYILGLIHDRRTIPAIREHLDDKVPAVRYEVATTLCVMGDTQGYPVLISGLEDAEIRNRYKAHEALKLLTRLDFGYEFDGEPAERDAAVAKWQTWYEEVAARNL